jgi:hypothetical protein
VVEPAAFLGMQLSGDGSRPAISASSARAAAAALFNEPCGAGLRLSELASHRIPRACAIVHDAARHSPNRGTGRGDISCREGSRCLLLQRLR